MYVTDEVYEPLYDLAKAYKKPVAIHMGQTAGSRAYLKYSHPLTLDEAAVRHPDVNFVMCISAIRGSWTRRLSWRKMRT